MKNNKINELCKTGDGLTSINKDVFSSVLEDTNAALVAAQKENADLRDSLREFDRQLRIHERRLSLLRTYDKYYVTDLGLTTLLNKDLFRSKDPSISNGREDLQLLEDARGFQIFQKCSDNSDRSNE